MYKRGHAMLNGVVVESGYAEKFTFLHDDPTLFSHRLMADAREGNEFLMIFHQT